MRLVSWILAFILSLGCIANVEAAQTFTLEQAVQYAMKANPGIESKVLLLEQAKMNIGVAQSYFWPRVSLVASNNRTKNYEPIPAYSSDSLSQRSWNKGLQGNWSLFAGFAHLNNLIKAKLNKDVAEANQVQAELELGCNVQLQFLRLLKQREDLKSAEESLVRIKKQLAASEAFVKQGMAPYLNVLQNQVELSKAQQNIIRVRNDIRNSEVQLNKYLNFPPDVNVNYVGRLKDFGLEVKYTEETAISTALKYRPDLKIAQKSIEVAFKDMNISMAKFLPRVDATYNNSQFSIDYDDPRYEDYGRHYWSAGVQFSWEIFSGGETSFDSLAQRKKAQALQQDFETALSSARAEVIRSLLDIAAAKELIGASRAGVTAARESYDMANRRYLTNTGTITELLDAQLRLTQAENDESQAFHDFQAARSKFYYYIGQKNSNLK